MVFCGGVNISFQIAECHLLEAAILHRQHDRDLGVGAKKERRRKEQIHSFVVL